MALRIDAASRASSSSFPLDISRTMWYSGTLINSFPSEMDSSNTLNPRLTQTSCVAFVLNTSVPAPTSPGFCPAWKERLALGRERLSMRRAVRLSNFSKTTSSPDSIAITESLFSQETRTVGLIPEMQNLSSKLSFHPSKLTNLTWLTSDNAQVSK